MPSTSNTTIKERSHDSPETLRQANLLLRLFKTTVVACILAAVLGLVLLFWQNAQVEPNPLVPRLFFGLTAVLFIGAQIVNSRLKAFFRRHK